MSTVRKVLLIDDDRGQFKLTQAFFSRFRGERFELDWTDSFSDGLEKLVANTYAAALLDYQLGDRDGIQLICEAVAAGSRTPIVFLTAETAESVDLQAMASGALDYLVKGEINARSLERSLRYAMKLAENLESLRTLAIRDGLTGLLNRREFDRLIAEEEDRARKFAHSLSLIFFDVDFFKRVNDAYGHATGDTVLQAVAARIASEVRSVDRLCRYGGEEFTVIMPETDEATALLAAGRMVRAVHLAPIYQIGKALISVTLSAGVASLDSVPSESSMMQRADRALYAAKMKGRNCAVSIADL